VYTRAHTHTAHIGYSDVSPGVGMRHLEGPKNPDGLNLGIYLFKRRICVQSTHVYAHARRQDKILDQLLFFLNIFFLSKKKSKRCEHKTNDNLESMITDLSAWNLK